MSKLTKELRRIIKRVEDAKNPGTPECRFCPVKKNTPDCKDKNVWHMELSNKPYHKLHDGRVSTRGYRDRLSPGQGQIDYKYQEQCKKNFISCVLAEVDNELEIT